MFKVSIVFANAIFLDFKSLPTNVKDIVLKLHLILPLLRPPNSPNNRTQV